MATSAARPNFQHYTAGSCTLEVEVQPSALSQWSARAIAKDLSFQLWLHAEVSDVDAAIALADAEVGESRQLIAAGDRTDLHALVQYFQQQTRQVLVMAQPFQRERETLTPRQRSAAAAPPPQSLQITAPLGYLQLCDITSVMGQYEQVMRTLPVALEVAAVDSVPNTKTAPERGRAAPLDNSNADSNVIPLAARRQRERSTERRQRARRKRTGVWASSAAAALFAVGLTTTLLSRDPSLRETNVASDAVPEAQQEASQEGFSLLEENELEDSKLEESKPQAAATSPSQASSEDAAAADRESDESSEGVIPRDAAAQRNVQTDSTVEAETAESETAESETASSRPPTIAANPPRRPAARSPMPDSSVGSAQFPERQPPEASRGTSTAEREPAAAAQPPAPPPPSPVPAPPASALPAAASDAEASNRFPDNLDTIERRQPSLGQSQSEAILPEATLPEATERARQDAELRVPDVFAADVPTADVPTADVPTSDNSDLAGRTAPRAPSVERATPEPFSPPPDQQPRRTVGGASRGDIFTPPPSDRPSEALSGSIVSPAAIAINQVQTYFQQRWQDKNAAPLAYRLQLNAVGEVVSFLGLDDLSQSERDRLLPPDTPPVFASNVPLEESLVLRVQLNADGTVEVTPF